MELNKHKSIDRKPTTNMRTTLVFLSAIVALGQSLTVQRHESNFGSFSWIVGYAQTTPALVAAGGPAAQQPGKYEAPAQQAPVQQAPGKAEAPKGEAPVQQGPYQSPVQQAPGKAEAPKGEAPVQQGPYQSPVQQAPVGGKKSMMEQATADSEEMNADWRGGWGWGRGFGYGGFGYPFYGGYGGYGYGYPYYGGYGYGYPYYGGFYGRRFW
jgi:hypothetical protein